MIVFKVEKNEGKVSVRQLKKIKVGQNTLSLAVSKGMAAVGRIDSHLVVLDLGDYETLSKTRYGHSMIQVVHFLEDSKHIAMGFGNGQVLCVDWDKVIILAMLSGHNKDISAIAYSSTPFTVAVGSFDGSVALFQPDLKDIEEKAKYFKDIEFSWKSRMHQGPVKYLEVRSDSQGVEVISSGKY